MKSEQIINSRQSLEAYKKYLDVQFEINKYLRMSIKTGRQRTSTQNAALHLFCGQLSDALNDASIDFRVFVKEGYRVPFTKDLALDYVWRPVQKAITGHTSTTQPQTYQYSKIYDSVNVKIAEYGIYVPWPTIETKKQK